MSEAWLERESDGRIERHPLRRGLTRIGGPRADVKVAGVADDELQLWDDPPKLVHLGGEPHPSVNGDECTEARLEPGDAIVWRGTRFVFRALARRAALSLESEAELAEVRASEPAPRATAKRGPSTDATAATSAPGTTAAASNAPRRTAAPRSTNSHEPSPSLVRDTFWRLAFALAVLALVAALLLWGRAKHGLSLDAWADRLLGGAR
ncbi:MAG: hypothetical protein L6Q99_07825 [Planctomycetes bacterium]|nr:hypothetical protein [Planctomycetota bacterium]